MVMSLARLPCILLLKMLLLFSRRAFTNSFQTRRIADKLNSGFPIKASTQVATAESSGREAPGPKSMVPYFPIYYNDVYEVKLPKNHRFPMEKYRQVREMVQQRVSTAQRSRLKCEFRVSPLATVEELGTTHCSSYVDRFLRGDLTELELRNIGFPWSESGVKRALSSVGGTIAAASAVCEALRERQRSLDQGREDQKVAVQSADLPLVWAAHVAGGTHHAFKDRGEGFCIFSDIAVASNVVLLRYPDVVRRILIVDLDVHQGNGNAVLFQGRDDVLTFSMHCKANYFSKKEKSDLDVELPAGCTDQTYLATLNHWLGRIKREGGNYDLIFFQAGVDVIAEDRLGCMSLSSDGVRQRNEMVFDFAREMDTSLVITMGGGYPQNDWATILEAHANVYFQAHQYVSRFASTLKS